MRLFYLPRTLSKKRIAREANEKPSNMIHIHISIQSCFDLYSRFKRGEKQATALTFHLERTISLT